MGRPEDLKTGEREEESRSSGHLVFQSSNLPRVCLLTEMFYPVVGGGETHARLLAESLNAMGTPTWVLTRQTDHTFRRSELIGDTLVYRLPPSGVQRLGKYLMIPAVMSELHKRRDDYDVILVCGFRVLGVPAVLAAGKLNKACILRAEALGEMSGSYASAYRKLSSPMHWALSRYIGVRNKILRQADAFQSISRPVSREFEACGVPSDRIFEIPNGIDTDLYHPVDAQTHLELRRNLGLPVGKKIVGYSGKLNKGKGLECLVKAWAAIRVSHPDAHLLLIGSGGGQTISCEDQLRAMARDLRLEDSVTFTGYVEKVHEYLQACDVFVFPSENESFGLSLVEAMACALPSVACEIGPIPEILRHNHEGIVIKPRDESALADALDMLLSRPSFAKSLGENARQSVVERYSMSAIAVRYRDMLVQVAGSP